MPICVVSVLQFSIFVRKLADFTKYLASICQTDAAATCCNFVSGASLECKSSWTWEPVFDDAALSQPGSFQCQQILDSLSASTDALEGHAADVEPVSNMEIPQARIVVWNHFIMLPSNPFAHLYLLLHISLWADTLELFCKLQELFVRCDRGFCSGHYLLIIIHSIMILMSNLPVGLKHFCIPGGRPPTESLKDVRDTGFFDRFGRGCTVHADGNKAWKSESKRRSVKFASVSHNKMQFTKWHSKTRLTGTQALDKVWSHLRKHVPKSLGSRGKSDRRFNPRMEQYVYSYMWRFNNRNWWKQLGQLCQ